MFFQANSSVLPVVTVAVIADGLMPAVRRTLAMTFALPSTCLIVRYAGPMCFHSGVAPRRGVCTPCLRAGKPKPLGPAPTWFTRFRNGIHTAVAGPWLRGWG